MLTQKTEKLLKKAGLKTNVTPEQFVELMRCLRDPIYFIETYVKIVHPDRGRVPFELYDYQRKIVKSMHNNRNTIIATSRQVGKTTSAVGYTLWYVLFNPEKTVAIVANKGDTSKKILATIKESYLYLPDWIKHGVDDGGWNKETVKLENGSKIISASTSSDTVRGETINLLIVDEAAYIDNWDVFWKSVSATTSASQTSKIVLISTPNGLNHFFTIWAKAEKKMNEYHPIKVMWYEAPNRNEAWKKRIIETDLDGNIQAFEQEYCVEFLGSSGTLISGAKLRQLVALVNQPIYAEEKMYQYKKVVEGHSYVTICDVSRGKLLDYSAFHVIDVTKVPYEQVCVFRDNSTMPPDYAGIIVRMSKYYNNAQILVEINDLGGQVVDEIHDKWEYENVLYTTTKGSRSGKTLSSGFGAKNRERGIRTTQPVKANGCAMIKMLVEQDKLIVTDKFTIDEMNVFSKKANGSYAAEPGKHDDLMMGLVLFGWLSDQSLFKELTNTNIVQELKEFSDDQMNSMLTPFGFFDNGIEPPDEEDLDWSVDPLNFSWF